MALLLAACGAPTRQAAQAPTATGIPPVPTVQPTPTVSQNVPGGYLLVDDHDVQFVQWVGDASGHVQGTYQRLHVPQGDFFQAEPTNGTFTLAQQPNSKDVQVTFDHGQAYVGTLQGDMLTLVVPSESGELRTLEYHRATVEDYNTAARNLQEKLNQAAAEYQAAVQQAAAEQQAQAAQASAAAAQASAAAAAQQARAQAMRAWQSAYEDANTALADIATIPEDAWFTEGDEGQTANVVRDVQATTNTIKTMVTDGDCLNFSYEVSNLHYHASQLDYVRSTFDYTINNLQNATATMQEKRDVLGAAATDHMISETTRMAEVAQQQIERVNKKYEQANQIVQGAIEEAEALTCTPDEQ
jgi:hypothetical protein